MRFARQALLGMGLLALLSLTLTGCGKSVAKINGEKISRDEYNSRMEKMAINSPNGARQQVGALVLQQLIQEKLKLQFAKKLNVEPTKDQINSRVADLKRQGVYKTLKDNGYTDQEIEDDIRVQQANFNVLTKDVTATDKELKDFYEQNKLKYFTTPAGADLGMIVAASKEKIDKARKMIKVDNNAFTAVAAQYNDIPQLRQSQGDIGFMPSDAAQIPKDRPQLPPTVHAAVFKLKVGEVTEPIFASKTWYLVKMKSSKAQETKGFESVRNQVNDAVMMRKAQELYGGTGRTRKTPPDAEFRKFIKDSKAKINVLRYSGMWKGLQDQVAAEEKAAAGASAAPGGTVGAAKP
jgi:foldase protein PrsA